MYDPGGILVQQEPCLLVCFLPRTVEERRAICITVVKPETFLNKGNRPIAKHS